MSLDPGLGLAGLIVGFVIGLTGMGGGALMTPILVLVFGVQPLAAVSSDLVASLVMKPFGSAVHLRHGTVNWRLVRWLILGSVPAAFTGVLIIRLLGSGGQLQDRVQTGLGAALLLAAAAIVTKLFVDSYRAVHTPTCALQPAQAPAPLKMAPVRTVAIGALGGLLVGMTSTGSGTMIIVCLMMLYPTLALRTLVGTDLVQAVPLVAAAALGHLLFGDVHLGLTASLLIGAIPGVLAGARLSARAPDLLIRPFLALVLVGTALKLLGVGTTQLGLVLLSMVLVGLPLWSLFDTSIQPAGQWTAGGLGKRRALIWQAAGIPIALGPVAAIVYFTQLRPHLPHLKAAAAGSPTATGAR